MADIKDLGTTYFDERLRSAHCEVAPVIAPAAEYVVGQIVEGVTVNTVADEARTVVIAENKTLAAQGKIDAIIIGRVKRTGLTNLTDALEGKLFKDSIIVD